MARAEITLSDPSLTVTMAITAPDGLLPALAQWIIDTRQSDPITGALIGYKTEQVTDADGNVATQTNPLPLDEVYNKLFGQMYYGWVGKMIADQAAKAAETVAAAERAKYVIPDYAKV